METSNKQAALVIGAGDATGGAVAKRFAREGAKLVVTDVQADKVTLSYQLPRGESLPPGLFDLPGGKPAPKTAGK